MSSYKHGTPHVWKEVFKGNDVIYSDNPQTQNQLFEHTKISFLREIFPTPKNVSQAKPSMLEVGCGSAFVSLYFAKCGYRVSGLDINKDIIEIAKKNFKKENTQGTFVVGTAEKLPFKDNSFDIVSSFGLIEHFEDPTPAFSEMVRVLKKGGLFFADIVPNRFSVQSIGNIFNFFVTLPFSSKKAIRNFRPLYFESSQSWVEYKKLIEKAGIKKVGIRGNRPWPRLTLPSQLDKIYTKLIFPTLSLWKKFDRSDNWFPKFWGAGLWFWGVK